MFWMSVLVHFAEADIKLHCAKRKSLKLNFSKCSMDVSGFWGIWDELSHNANLYFGQINFFFFYSEKLDSVCSRLKTKGAIHVLYKSHLYFYNSSISAEEFYVGFFFLLKDLCCLRDFIFLRYVHALTHSVAAIIFVCRNGRSEQLKTFIILYC